MTPFADCRKALACLLLSLTWAFASGAYAQDGQAVVATERVTRGVLVREAPDGDAPVVEALVPGEALPYAGSVPNWHRVTLPDGRTGYVSNRWTEVEAAEPVSAAGGVYRVHVVDVGTGLGVFVEGPDFTLVYDAGSNDDKALGDRNRFLAYLRFARPDLQTIDHVILSHAHQDHVLMLPDLMARYRVRHVWDSGRMFTTCIYRSFLEAVAREPGVAYHQVSDETGPRRINLPAKCNRPAGPISLQRGDPITAEPVALGQDASITFLHRDDAEHEDPNENSLVARLDLGPIRVLLTGDAEGGARRHPDMPPDPGSVEEKLLACCRAALKADILFAGHHGSSTSSRRAFVDAVGARYFVISSGPQQYSGTTLPTPEVVALLRSRGTVLETYINDGSCPRNAAKIGPDDDGRPGGCDNILITIDGETITPRYIRSGD